jgi:hypothetical protein
MLWRHNPYCTEKDFPKHFEGQISLAQLPLAPNATISPYKLFSGQWGARTTPEHVAGFVYAITRYEVHVEKIKEWTCGPKFKGCFHIYCKSEVQKNALLLLNKIFWTEDTVIGVHSDVRDQNRQVGEHHRQITIERAISDTRHKTLVPRDASTAATTGFPPSR